MRAHTHNSSGLKEMNLQVERTHQMKTTMNKGLHGGVSKAFQDIEDKEKCLKRKKKSVTYNGARVRVTSANLDPRRP